MRGTRDVGSITRLGSDAAEECDRMQDAFVLLKLIAQAEVDVADGELVSVDEAFAGALESIDR